MDRYHVGRGETRGALTVFPVWGEVEIEREYTTAVSAAGVSEKGTPEVNTLHVTNSADRPLLLLEGQLLEGGLQNRMVARSVMVAPASEVDVDVLCVEAGRWRGGSRHADSRRRASNRVRASSRSTGNRQSEVWQRVSEYDARYGANATSSLTEHVDRAARDVTHLVAGLRPFPGQIGIVTAVSGQPVSGELFDSPVTLHEQFHSIVAAAALDAVGRRAEATPSRRALRFIDRAADVQLGRGASAGVGLIFGGGTEGASVSVLRLEDRDVHIALLNPRHELVGAP